MVSLGTVETVELQFIIDQSLALGIFLHPPSFPESCGVWKVVAPPSFLSPLRQSQWTTTLSVLITGRVFFFLFFSLQFIRTALISLKDCYPEEQCCLFWIVLCSSYLLSSNYAKAANSFYKESSGKQFENVNFLLPLQTSLQYDSNITQYNGNDNLLGSQNVSWSCLMWKLFQINCFEFKKLPDHVLNKFMENSFSALERIFCIFLSGFMYKKCWHLKMC